MENEAQEQHDFQGPDHHVVAHKLAVNIESLAAVVVEQLQVPDQVDH